MNLICRLCLSVDHKTIHNLFENSILMMKITSCLKVELTQADCLPNLICEKCIEKVEDIYSFNKKLTENQNTLYAHMKNGAISLATFYSNLKGIEVDKVIPVEIPVENINLNLEDNGNGEEIMIKIENEVNIEETNEEFLDSDFDSINGSEDEEMIIAQIKNESKPNNRKRKAATITEKKIKAKSREEAEETNHSGSDTEIEDDDSKSNNYEFKCLTCFETFEYRRALSKHYQTAHGPDKSEETEDINNFIIVEDSNKYRCGKCLKSDKVFKTKKSILRHLDKTHQQCRPYLCNLCGRTYKDIHDIIRHIRAHSENRLRCSFECGYSTAYASALRVHEAKHRGDYKYKCEKCGKGFQVKTWFDEHHNIHNGVKPYTCDVCGQAFHLKSSQESKRKKLTRDERLERKRIAEQARRARIKQDPVLHAQMKEQLKQLYCKKKALGIIKPIKDRPRREQKIIREKNRRFSRIHYYKKKLQALTNNESLIEPPLNQSVNLATRDPLAASEGARDTSPESYSAGCLSTSIQRPESPRPESQRPESQRPESQRPESQKFESQKHESPASATKPNSLPSKLSSSDSTSTPSSSRKRCGRNSRRKAKTKRT